ncbi:sugar-binding protein [Ferruginibacter sp. SUN002]|uniref:sugar-binding protein n=1 Tax=Ferruginibacter sp. SUN002 TaxID=2937789 RepID=UPI003D3668B2
MIISEALKMGKKTGAIKILLLNILAIFVAGQGYATIFYSKATGQVQTLTNWGVNSDGTGTAPIAGDFALSTHTFIIRGAMTMAAGGWTVYNLQMNSGGTLTATTGVTITNLTVSGGTLTFGTVASSATAASITSGSLVVNFASSVGSVLIDGGTLNINNGNLTVNGGAFTYNSGTLTMASTRTLFFTGTSSINGTLSPTFARVQISSGTTTANTSFTITNATGSINPFINNGTFQAAAGVTATFNVTGANSNGVFGTGSTTFTNLTIASGTFRPGAAGTPHNFTVKGTFTNDATFTHNNSTVTFGTGGSIAASAGTVTFYKLNINTTTNTDVVTLSKSLITITNELLLTSGRFQIGSANTVNMSAGSSIAGSANGNIASTGTNGSDGGTVRLFETGGATYLVKTAPVTFYNLATDGSDGDMSVDLAASGSIINGTFTCINNTTMFTTNSPIWGAASTLSMNRANATYTPGLEWVQMAPGTIGVTPGYPNNVIIMNVGTAAGNPATNDCGVYLASGAWSINGTLTIGSSSVTGNVDITQATPFTCGGVTIENGSKLVGTNILVKGNWLRTGASIGTYVNYGSGTVTFGGSGTSGSPQTINLSTAGPETSFNNVTVSNGTYVRLDKPVTIGSSNVFNLSSGIVETSGTNILYITNTATGGLTGTGSSTNYINGPVKWDLPSTTSTYTFPIGKGTKYLPFAITPNTPVNTLTVEAFTGSTGGNADNTTVSAISTAEYWQLTTTANFNTAASSISVSRTDAISPYSILAKSATQGGTYVSIGGTGGTYGVSGSTGIGTGPSPWFFVLGSTPPIVTTVAATSIGTASALLNGTVNANNQSTAISFEYGTTTSYGTSVTSSPSSLSNATSTSVSGNIGSGLIPNTLYNFRVKGVYGSSVTVNGSNLTFTTHPNPPVVGSGNATSSSGFTANWTAPATQGSETFTYTVEISTDITFTTGVTTQTGINSSTLSHAFTGLPSVTTYYYRVKAVNASGSSAWSSTSAAVSTTFTIGPNCSSGNGASGTPALIPITGLNPVVDGSVDAVWANAYTNSITKDVVGSHNTNGTMTWKAMYTSDTLYFLLQVTDASLQSTGSTNFDRDGIELYIDANNSKGGTYDGSNDFQIRLNYNDPNNVYGSSDGVGNQGGAAFAALIPKINWKQTAVAGTSYTIEVALPWAQLNGGTVPATMGLDVEVNDNDNGSTRTSQSGWYTTNTNAWNNPSLFGTASLSTCQVPNLNLPTATSITENSAVLGANVYAANGTLVASGHGTAMNTSSGVTSQNASSISGTAVQGTPFSHTVSGLLPQTRYYYVGYAMNGSGTGISTEGAFWTLSNPPTVQPAFTTTASTCTSVTLNWNAATFPGTGASATGYILLRRQGSTPTTTGIVNATAPGSLSLPVGTTLVTTITSGSTVTYTNTSLTAGTSYTYLLVPFTWNGSNDSTRHYLTTSIPPVQTISLSTSGTWLGVNTNWTDVLNWCSGAVPTTSDNVVVPDYGTTGNYPILTSGVAAVCRNISIIGNASITINTGASFDIYGTYTSTGSLINNGDFGLKSTTVAQSFPGSTGTITAMNNLNVNNTSGLGVTFDRSFSITGALTPTAGTVNINNATITLVSSATATARIGIVGSGFSYSNGGQFSVERYLPMQTPYSGRRWRLMGVPISTDNAPTIKAAWQEDATVTSTPSNATTATSIYNPYPGYGTHITNGIGSVNNGIGFDAGSTSSPSIYKLTAGLWSAPTATTIPITNHNAYMLFVRGDRSIVVSSPYINTTGGVNLRIKGRVNTGTVTVGVSTGKQVISNPYASAISLRNVNYIGAATFGNTTGITYYLWDPKLLGSKNVGGWVSCSSNGSNVFTIVPYPISSAPGMSSYSDTARIESGGAFMINPVSAGNIVFHETDKLTTSTTVGLASRPTAPPAVVSEMYTNLAYVDDAGNPILADGVATTYSDNYHNEVDDQDAPKLQTFATKEKISLLRNDSVLAIERRATITTEDTIYLQMNKLDYNYQYQLQFVGKRFAPQLSAYLEDNYLHLTYPISTEGLTRHNFSTNNEDASLATDRFKVVFKIQPQGGPLPVRFVNIKAAESAGAVNVQWEVAEEINVKQYAIERSGDGIHFTTLTNVSAQQHLNYTWLDNNANVGLNYYRIISIGTNGEKLYSQIVSVMIGKMVSGFIVTPNPVVDHRVNIQMNHVPKGVYEIRLINSIGQEVMTDRIVHQGGNSGNKVLQLNRSLASGVYQLEIKGSVKYNLQLILEN